MLEGVPDLGGAYRCAEGETGVKGGSGKAEEVSMGVLKGIAAGIALGVVALAVIIFTTSRDERIVANENVQRVVGGNVIEVRRSPGLPRLVSPTEPAQPPSPIAVRLSDEDAE